MRSASTLCRVDLAGCRGFSTQAIHSLVAACHQLQDLDLGHCDGASGALVALENDSCAAMRKLYLNWVGISDAALSAAIKGCPNLELLNAHGRLDAHDPGLATLGALSDSCPQLQHLDFRKCQINDHALAQLASSCSSLRHVHLKLASGITNEGVRPLLERCPQLAFLGITYHSAVTSACFAGLVCPAMQTFLCDGTGLSDWNGNDCSEADLRDLLVAFPNLRCLHGLPFHRYLTVLEAQGVRHQLQYGLYIDGFEENVYHPGQEKMEKLGIVEAPSKCLCCGEVFLRNGTQSRNRFFKDP